MTHSAIDCKNLFFSYGETVVLNDVSFTIHQGEMVSVIGPNGGGKTTLLKLLMGFLEPSQGSLSIFGSEPQQARNHIAYVPQCLRVDRQFPISVLDVVLTGLLKHLTFWGRYQKKDKQAALEALKKVNLEELASRSFGTLSSGQAQRVLIARALVSQPSLLLLDEPTANVDSASEEQIFSLLHQLAGTMTILIVTHDLRAVIEETRRVLLVQRNVLLLKPEAVCEHFAFGVYHPPLIQLKGESHS